MSGDDTDRRFAELMRSEFGDSPRDKAASHNMFSWTDPDPDPEPEPHYTLDHVELDDEDYEPSEPRPPAGPIGWGAMSGLTKLGIALMCFAFVVGLAGVFITGPHWFMWSVPVALGAGIVVLITRLPHRRSDDDDGIRL